MTRLVGTFPNGATIEITPMDDEGRAFQWFVCGPYPGHSKNCCDWSPTLEGAKRQAREAAGEATEFKPGRWKWKVFD